jgi:excisionase family DNA binding protein
MPDFILIDRSRFDALMRELERSVVSEADVLTTAEAARVLGCSLRNVNELCQRGRLRVLGFKGLRLIRADAVEALMAERRRNPEAYAARVATVARNRSKRRVEQPKAA